MLTGIFHRLFVANRGEVAARIGRACDALGIEPVFGVSEADAGAPWTRGRKSVLLGPARAAQSYLDPVRVVQAAAQAECAAVHPGWGFLSENHLFASLCRSHGLVFVGPPPAVMALMGRKIPAKRTMVAAGLAVIPGSEGGLADADEALRVAGAIGYPVLLKPEAGGGGRGLRAVASAAELPAAFAEAGTEARAAFGDSRLYLEKLIEGGRHIEIQILADGWGNAVHLGERDCTIQRSHQKLVEESPSPALDDAERAGTLAAAARAAAAIGYAGAGTMEFLLDPQGTLRFMEMNCRLQVEHSVTEVRTGIDLVAEQLRIAAGHRLPFGQADVVLRGHALECRINAEDPAQGFRPAPGTITRWEPPAGEGVRVDTHVETGYVVPPHYDSLLAKVITSGANRDQAVDRMIAALSALICEGVPTTVPMHLAILRSAEFRENRYDTRTIPGWPPS